METNYKSLMISLSDATDLVAKLFNVKGVASQLDGEIDFNFKIECANKDWYILKISRPNESFAYLDFQQELLQFAIQNAEGIIVPTVILDQKGKAISQIVDQHGQTRFVRLLTWVSGRLWSSVNPQTDRLRYDLGEKAGQLTKALQGFEHPEAYRVSEWDNAQVAWVYDYLQLFEGEQLKWMTYFHSKIKKALPRLQRLRKAIVHNDINDNNIVVSENFRTPKVIALIDYGDAIHTSIINDLGVAGMYVMMKQPDVLSAFLPFVQGYHTYFPLEEQELELLYISVAIRLVISLTKATINKEKEPENDDHQISTQAAWNVLEQWYAMNENLATYSFRQVCGFEPHPEKLTFERWAQEQQYTLTDLFPTINKTQAHWIDLGLESDLISSKDDFENLAFMEYKLSELQSQFPDCIFAGGYLEPRFIYTTDAYRAERKNGYEYRTVHLGLDFWLPSQTPVHVLTDGEVVTVHDNGNDKDYGPTIMIKHHYNEDTYFYTLYGHLSLNSLKKLVVGQKVKRGDLIGWVGEADENGSWVPHLHFQIMLDLLGNTVDFPGVARPSERLVWESICPDPNYLFNLTCLNSREKASNQALIDYRKTHLGKGLSLQYKNPIKMVRGDAVYLIDQYGQKYLDTVNNVAHVGHEHPKVVKAGQKQMAILNTNSRYLHDIINEFAKDLLATLPKELSVLHFVNSGSEANELALRMLKTATGERDIIASEFGYHGNTIACIEISSYKFDGKGGAGASEYTHIIPLPDAFRGKYRGENTGKTYAQHVQIQIDSIQKKGRNLAGFIIEPIISCGGQVELPKGFLKEAYRVVRMAGGYCISDEVQVGCGRVGNAFWGFQLHDVIPDIVTIGKPLGNGHPLAAVACTAELADKFANGMEYFNTFGGNPVSCAIGREVLRTIKREKLQDNARIVGSYLKTKLKELAKKYPIIGDVRGEGLFLGLELVDDACTPLPEQTDYLANRMKEHRILMSVAGSQYNVLKIKPPMVFSLNNANELIDCLAKIFAEDFMQVY